jgi:transposase
MVNVMKKIRKKSRALRSDLCANLATYVLRDGNTRREAAEKFGVSYSTAKRICVEESRGEKHVPKSPVRKIKIDKAELQAADNQCPRLSVAELAEKFDVTTSAIYAAKKRFGTYNDIGLYRRNEAAYKKAKAAGLR